jgi:hypothetical protein
MLSSAKIDDIPCPFWVFLNDVFTPSLLREAFPRLRPGESARAFQDNFGWPYNLLFFQILEILAMFVSHSSRSSCSFSPLDSTFPRRLVLRAPKARLVGISLSFFAAIAASICSRQTVYCITFLPLISSRSTVVVGAAAISTIHHLLAIM